jgi:Na+/Pi-cotransporter
MLGLEFMSNGIQNLAVSRMRALLGRIAGTPIKGVRAGTIITGVIQSSTAMTVMVVGRVNSGVLALRPAIAMIMGANWASIRISSRRTISSPSSSRGRVSQFRNHSRDVTSLSACRTRRRDWQPPF